MRPTFTSQTLEHLENAFYSSSLAKLSAKDFEDAGYKPWIRQRFVEIGGDEAVHVATLSSALGDQATKACTYDFGVNSVKDFIATSVLLEGVGVSVRTPHDVPSMLRLTHRLSPPFPLSVPRLTLVLPRTSRLRRFVSRLACATHRDEAADTNFVFAFTQYLTVAGSILTTEARHASWAQSSAALNDPAANPFDTPAGSFSQVYSLAAPLIKSCPKSNPTLPVKAFPALKVSESVLKPGATVKVSGDGVKDGQQVAFLNALTTMFAPIKNGQVTVPQIGGGRTYALVVPGDAKTVSDDNTIAGPVASDLLYSPYKGEQIGLANMKKAPVN